MSPIVATSTLHKLIRKGLKGVYLVGYLLLRIVGGVHQYTRIDPANHTVSAPDHHPVLVRLEELGWEWATTGK